MVHQPFSAPFSPPVRHDEFHISLKTWLRDGGNREEEKEIRQGYTFVEEASERLDQTDCEGVGARELSGESRLFSFSLIFCLYENIPTFWYYLIRLGALAWSNFIYFLYFFPVMALGLKVVGGSYLNFFFY